MFGQKIPRSGETEAALSLTPQSHGRPTSARTALLASLSFAICGGAFSAAAAQTPDLIIYNGKIVTVDGKFSVVQAAAIEDGKFSQVGDNKAVLASAGRNTRKVDLKGRTVLPGFNDSHVHVMASGKTLETDVDLTHVRSIADIQAAIAAKAKTLKPGEWITGTRGWWQYELAEDRIPTRYDLDKAAPDNPVTIPGPHYAVVNSLGLKLAGITKDSPNPQGGEIRKDPKTGEPTGLLYDNANRAVRVLIPQPTPEQVKAGVLKAVALVNSNGVTSIGDFGSMEDVKLWRQLYDEGKLTLRVDMSFDVDPAQPLGQMEKAFQALGKPRSHDFGDGMFRSDEIGEAGLDGAGLTAMMRQPYVGQPNYTGLEKVPQRHFNEFALLAARYGWRLRPHVAGDAAIDEALTSFEYANARVPIADRRWMLDHAFLLLPDHYPRVKALGLFINSEYMHHAQQGKLLVDEWGPEIMETSENYRSWIDSGITFANGSDGPISYHALPLYQIYGTVTRKTMWGGILGKAHAITREEAIKSVTINGAMTSFEEKVKGSIEPGKYADFVVISGDVLTVPEDDIKDLKVLTTVVGGKPVFGKLQ